MVKSYIINLLFSFNLLFFIIFIIIFIISHFCCKKWYTFSCDTALNSEMCNHWFSHFHSSYNISCCVVSFLWGPQAVWFVILHLECSTQIFLGICVTWQCLGDVQCDIYVTRSFYGDLQVILGSPGNHCYTGYTFDFNVNTSYLSSIKLQIKVL